MKLINTNDGQCVVSFPVLLTFEVIAPAIVGAIIPGMVAAVFDNPNNNPEYLPNKVDVVDLLFNTACHCYRMHVLRKCCSQVLSLSSRNPHQINVSPKNKQTAHNQVYNRQIGLRPSQHMLVLHVPSMQSA